MGPLINKYRVIASIFVIQLIVAAVFSQTISQKDSDLIHQGDIVEIDVVGSFEFDWRGTLNPEGFLDRFDKVTEPVYARCLSTTELADSVAREYSRVLRDPKVVVRIIDRNGRALAYLDGGVKNPMRMRIKRDVFLNELIVMAGGFIDSAGGEISIFRPENSSCEGHRSGNEKSPVSRSIKIADLIAGVEGSNPKIVSGDIVIVSESLPIYVVGGVNNPGVVAYRNEMTLSRAVSSAGGVAKNGVASQVVIFRRKQGSSSVIEADLESILKGSIADPILEPYDTIDVSMKGVEKRRFSPVIERKVNRGNRETIPIRVID